MGDVAGSGCERPLSIGETKPLQVIERNLITKYRKQIWSKFVKAVNDYKLVEDGDKVAVAVSGGKDSMLMAKLFQELNRHGKIKFQLEFIVMDPGYHPHIKKLLLDNLQYLNIPFHIFETKIFAIAEHIAKDYPCYMCAKMRRGALYGKAQELGCNKLALGHHFNDVIETTMLNLVYVGSFKTMLPKLKSTNFKGLELIRPMYYIEEEHIGKFTEESGVWPLNCACMVTAERTANKRYEIKELIKELKEKYFDQADKSIFKAAANINMNCVLGWKKGDKSFSYLDFYEEE